MKKVLFVALLLAGCAVSSNVQNYRLANDQTLHSFNVVQSALGNSWELFIDGAAVCSGGFDLLSYEKTISAVWNGRNVQLRLKYDAGFLGIGKKVTAAVAVGGEKIAEFIF